MSDIAYSNAFALAENVNTNGNEIAISFLLIAPELEISKNVETRTSQKIVSQIILSKEMASTLVRELGKLINKNNSASGGGENA